MGMQYDKHGIRRLPTAPPKCPPHKGYIYPGNGKQVMQEQRKLARRMVRQALRDGRLRKPERCEACGKVKYLTAHHENYLKPLKVSWVCLPCHAVIDNFKRTTE